MPFQSELEHLLETSLSRRDLLLLGTAGAAYLTGLSRQDAHSQVSPNEVSPQEDLENNKPFADPAFEATWARTDSITDGTRSWIWGPAPFTNGIMEPYVQAPGGQRLVQYFDKSRMEITHPDGDQNSIWYVTNGLLARELMTGKKQIGDNDFEVLQPARIGVAGDPTWKWAVTYEKLGGVMNVPPPSEHAYPSGVGNWLEPWGEVKYREDLAHNWGLQANIYVPDTDHVVANVFWDFMMQSGPVIENGQILDNQPLFPNPFYGTGYPLTEPWWIRTRFADSSMPDGFYYKDVVVQAFERRTLTYTPENNPPFQVESGNIGRDYYAWSRQHAA